MKKTFAYLRKRPLAFASIIVLALLYFTMIFAEFIAPYPATLTFEENTFHPANIRITKNGLVAKEAKTISMINWKYAFVKGAEHKVKFFVKGAPYKLFGAIPCDRHLFGTVAQAENGAQAQEAGDQNSLQAQETPAAYPVYILGADNLGRDMFSRMVYGSRISLTIGFVATAVSMLLAIILGGAAGYYGAKTDWAIMRFAEFFMLVPSLYLILFLRSLLNSKLDSGTSYMIITMILSLVGWPGSARTIRGMVHAIKREDFVQNAALESLPSLSIIFRHIIPQMSSLLIVSAALSVPGFIMSETTLSYLGLGIADPSVSWGSMINREISTLSNLSRYPWLLNPVWLLLAVTLAFNFLADALRDYYDPYHAIFPTWKRKKSADKTENAAQKDARDEREHDILVGQNDAPADQNSLQDQNAAQKDARDEREHDNLTDALLQVKDLRVEFLNFGGGSTVTRAVRGVNFYVKRGEILGIVGESGSGKSVSTTAIPGLLPSNACVYGKIIFDGVELSALSQKELRPYRGKKIALILQEPGRSFDPLQNVGSVFYELYKNNEPNITKAQSDARAAKILGEVGLPDPEKRLKNYPHQFSGGQLQRIGIALALAQNAELLIADEPTTALDVTIQAQIVSLLLDLKKKRGLSIIFISHNIDLVAQISDRMIVMYGGKIMESGSARDIYERPKNPYTKALLGALPKFGTSYKDQKLLSIPGSIVDPRNPPPGCPFEPRCSFANDGCRAANYSCWKEGEAEV